MACVICNGDAEIVVNGFCFCLEDGKRALEEGLTAQGIYHWAKESSLLSHMDQGLVAR